MESIILIKQSRLAFQKKNSKISSKDTFYFCHRADGSILVPTNQLLRPAGFQINLPGRPVDLALSPDEKLLFVKNRKSLDLIRLIDRTVLQSLPYNRSGASFTGLCLSSDEKKVFVTEARDRIHIAVMSDDLILQWEKPIILPKPSIGGKPVPGGLTLNDNGDKIFVTLSRNNSLAVVDLKDTSIVEISVGISPYDVLLVSPQKAYVTNWGGRQPNTGEPTYNSSGSQVLVDPKTGIANNGAVSVVDLNTNVQKKIIEVGLHPSGMVLSPDRTRLYVACANSDTSLVHFGRDVTPNHHSLAETFGLLDNYYCSGILSADGHQWTDEAYVTDYIEKFFGDFTRSYPYDGNDALAYASSGFIWDNVLRHGLTFRNYGEFVTAIIEPKDATFTQMYDDYKNGTDKVKIRAKANLEQLIPYTCPTFVGFPNSVPEVYRAAEFIRELKEFEESDNFPNFIIMLLPNDHTSGTRPGRPTPRAAVADNDLALGQIVEAISNSKFWKETCIFVTEDDPQAGLDHVDGHRTIGLVISPYSRRGEVVSTYYSQINMVRTMENILGIPPMNQFDLSAEAMVSCFSSTADFTPYEAIPNIIPLEELNPDLESLTGDRRYWAQKSIEQDLDDYDRIEEDVFNRIIWHAVKGYDRPYPQLSKR